MNETKNPQSTKETLKKILEKLLEDPDSNGKLINELDSLVSKDSISEVEFNQIMEKINYHLRNNLEIAEEDINTSFDNICNLVGIDKFNEDVVLEFVNENTADTGW